MGFTGGYGLWTEMFDWLLGPGSAPGGRTGVGFTGGTVCGLRCLIGCWGQGVLQGDVLQGVRFVD